MKISYVIPAYNEEARIGKCLTALCAMIKENPHDAEIIVVRTGNDRTREIALGFPGVKVINEERRGLTIARNTGYLASTGDLVAHIDADTIMPSDWSAKVLYYFAKDPELIALSGPFVFDDVSKSVRAAVRAFYYITFATYLLNRFVLNIASMIQGGNFVVKREALDKIGGSNPKYDFYGEDADLARRLHKIGKVKFTMDLVMPASGRRLTAQGLITTGIRYGMNYFWTILLDKPLTKTSVHIRADEQQKESILKKAVKKVKKAVANRSER